MLHSKKSHYSEKDLESVLGLLKSESSLNLINCLSVLSYFNRETELSEIARDLQLDEFDALNRMYVNKELARAFKNLGRYSKASIFYCDMLRLNLDDINSAYRLTLFSKFLSDYYQRTGFNKSLLNIAFNRININYTSISAQQKSALRVIFDSYKKENRFLGDSGLINRALVDSSNNTARININKLEIELSKEENEVLFRDKFIEAIKLVDKQKVDGNEKSFGEKSIKLLSIYRRKSFIINDDLEFDSRIIGLKSNLDSIISNGNLLNDKKMVCGALREQLVFDVKSNNFESAIIKFNRIKAFLWVDDQIIYLPHYLFESLKYLLDYSIRIQESRALNLASLFLELNQILLSQLLIDESNFRDSVNTNSSENLFAIVKENLTSSEQEIVLKSFRLDYSILLANFQESLSIFNKINYLKQIFDQSELFEELINHNIHEFSFELKAILDENKNYQNINISNSVERLYEITNKWESDKNEIMAKELFLSNTIDEMMDLVSGYSDFKDVFFTNSVGAHVVVKFSDPLLKKILYILMQNVLLHKDNSSVANVNFNFVMEDGYGYLSVDDDIGGFSEFNKVISSLNKNSQCHIYSVNGSGKALRNIYSTLEKIVSKKVYFKLIRRSNSKRLLIPVVKYE